MYTVLFPNQCSIQISLALEAFLASDRSNLWEVQLLVVGVFICSNCFLFEAFEAASLM